MDCAEVRELLSEYADKEIDEGVMTEVEEHLATCRECAYRSSVILNLKKVFSHWDGVEGSKQFHERVMARVRRGGGERPPARIKKFIFSVLALLLVLAGGAFLTTHYLAGGLDISGFLDRIRASVEQPAEPTVETPPRPPREEVETPEYPTALGKVVLQSGTVRVIGAGKSEAEARPLRAGTPVMPDDTVRTGSDGTAKFVLPDGLAISLQPSSELQFGGADADACMKAGSALFSYAEASGHLPTESYAVHCGKAEVNISKSGTTVLLNAGARGITISVESGRCGVAVRGVSAERFSVEAGEKVVVGADGTVEGPSPVR